MTTTNAPEFPAENDTASAVAAGIELAGPQPIGSSDRFFSQLKPAGATVETFDLEQLEDKLAAYPRRKTGTVHLQDGQSFIDYIAKHNLPGRTEVYADPARKGLVGVINAHQEAADGDENEAGHGDHRVVLELVPTNEWKVWLSHDREFLTQQAFAEHIEDNAIDVTDPDSATMLEIAQSLIATQGVDFKQASRIDNGEVRFRYEETVTARAGQNGDFDIPSTFIVRIAPFEGCPAVPVVARFRYRIGSGGLKLSYALVRPGDVARDAFLAHVETVREIVDAPVFQGRPA